LLSGSACVLACEAATDQRESGWVVLDDRSQEEHARLRIDEDILLPGYAANGAVFTPPSCAPSSTAS
jgi:hypothetical protein